MHTISTAQESEAALALACIGRLALRRTTSPIHVATACMAAGVWAPPPAAPPHPRLHLHHRRHCLLNRRHRHRRDHLLRRHRHRRRRRRRRRLPRLPSRLPLRRPSLASRRARMRACAVWSSSAAHRALSATTSPYGASVAGHIRVAATSRPPRCVARYATIGSREPRATPTIKIRRPTPPASLVVASVSAFTGTQPAQRRRRRPCNIRSHLHRRVARVALCSEEPMARYA